LSPTTRQQTQHRRIGQTLYFKSRLPVG